MTDTIDAPAGMLSEEDFLQHMGITPDMSDDDIIQHFGVKGMHWGQRKGESGGSGSGGTPAKSRKELRSLDKASRAKDKQDFNAGWNGEIDAARARISSGANKQALKDAKSQYKADRAVIGKHAAKKALNEVKERVTTDAGVAQLAKTGKETRNAVLLGIGSAVLVGIAKGLQG